MYTQQEKYAVIKKVSAVTEVCVFFRMAEDSAPSTKYLSRAQRIIALSKEKADIMPELVKGTRNRNIPKRFIDFHTGLTNFPISAPKQDGLFSPKTCSTKQCKRRLFGDKENASVKVSS